ncbi:GNAT family N-acetyltransferase [Actinomadura barringtoniae]|uniref:GNAT family N-acetyltransferase n=1 Tax=Actinomadura barringtoniae TaxID=1427535 RepID=A0A939P5U1_9ACTN|nr:GNAT family N-acetyltransferase [Actinomadura barringtoniae]MBO2445745.1 GNAT family N-acetyltransferase [Actinomadura barringtoniae]
MGDAPYTVRPIGEAEYPAFWDVLMESFGVTRPIENREANRPLIDFDRTLAAFDDRLLIGTAIAHAFEMSVPGGVLPVAGITKVGVLPSHRRRGVLRAMMRRQLTDLHERGEAVAALFSSSGGFYQRFGFGCASRDMAVRVRRGESAFITGAPGEAGRGGGHGLRLTVADPDEAWPRLSAVYDAQLAGRPGQFARNGAWWHKRLYHREPNALRCVIAEDDARARGYALFFVEQRVTAERIPDDQISIMELVAVDPSAYAALWRHLLDRDLASAVVAARRPVDDPLLHLLADPRRLRAQVNDGLWVRVVDVDRALQGRVYGCDIDVVIEVHDPVCAWNSGRWHLSGGAAGARCERTMRSAHIAMPIHILGAAYLGGVGLQGPAQAGLVRELNAGAVDALSRALAWDPAPWCPMVF